MKAYQDKDYNKSIALFNKSLKLDKRNYYIYNRISKLYYYKNDLDSSIIYCDSALIVVPKDTTALYQRGHCYLDKNEFEKGLDDFNELFLLKGKKNADASYNIGECYLGMKKYDKAIEMYLLTLNLEPDDKYSYYKLGVSYASLPKPDKQNALKYYTKAIEQDKNYFSAYYNRGLLYGTQFKDFTKAHQDLERSIEIRPKYKDPYLFNARLYSQEQEFGKAKDVLNKLVELYPDYDQAYLDRALVWYNIGILNMVCHDLDKAESLGNKEATEYKKKLCK